MITKIISAAVVGLHAIPIEVEIDISSRGLPSFTIVGLPDKAVEESRERVRSAILNSRADFPAKKIIVNLAPADIQKEGPYYDLPMAVGILIASGQLNTNIKDSLFIGELSLDGKIRRAKGILPQAIMARDKKIINVFIPAENAKEASIIENIKIFPSEDLTGIFNHLSGQKQIIPQNTIPFKKFLSKEDFAFDMSDIKGQEKTKRAMEIAAAGSHNILLKGPPGAGKTLIARTLPSILPRLTYEEALEITKIYSIAGFLEKDSIITTRPFRSPHHTTSNIGIIGGGTMPKPGEVSLAHRGVLFLDEFPEFSRQVLESLRQPIEDSFVTISRSQGRITFPSKFMLVAAQNPCPCGNLGNPNNACNCSVSQILRYKKKISGPILDRIDIHLDVPPVKIEKLTGESNANLENSKQIRERVQEARDRQIKRFRGTKIFSNSEMTNKDIKNFCKLSDNSNNLLRLAVSKLNLSARSYYRTLKLAQTIADLEKSGIIKQNHIAEAIQYRQKTES